MGIKLQDIHLTRKLCVCELSLLRQRIVDVMSVLVHAHYYLGNYIQEAL